MAGFQVSPGQIQIMNHLKLPFLMTRECEHSGAIDIRSKHGINTMNDCDGRKPCFGFVSRGANLNPYPAMTAQRAVKHREREHTTMKIWYITLNGARPQHSQEGTQCAEYKWERKIEISCGSMYGEEVTFIDMMERLFPMPQYADERHTNLSLSCD